MANKLVIVESPAKARTLNRILGRNYSIKASLGHVRDLPRGTLGIDIDNSFTPKYVIPKQRSKTINELKKAVQNAAEVFLATDPDREGEAISWHLFEAADLDKKKKPVQRVSFHEITSEAVKEAFEHPRTINMDLVYAQQARRILDRLVGYKLSPLLWKKIQRGLSAGRVQSAALRMIVDREKEILAFKPTEYWVIEAELSPEGTKREGSIRATLAGYKDGAKLDVSNKKSAIDLEKKLRNSNYTVFDIANKQTPRNPAAPFTTSTLQQEAWKKLRYPSKKTMVIAQQLYEGISLGEEGSVGLITYMRTDSTNVAASALAETREYIQSKYSKDYLPSRPRSFGKKSKWAQEAHEAIRPTKIHREPEQLTKHLSRDQLKLYDLIWKRMVASQMAAALIDTITVEIEAACRISSDKYLFKTTSSTVKFPGFMSLYIEERDEDGGDSETYGKENNGKSSLLLKLKKEDALDLIDIFTEQNFTQPPPRYTEATLIKAMEQKGIGRPSTYAPIIATIQERNYVFKEVGRFRPDEIGTIVSDMLTEHFPKIVDLNFTAQMEKDLDSIARGEKDWVGVLQHFYKPFDKTLQKAASSIEKINTDKPSDEVCPVCGQPMVIKSGRFGKYLACSDEKCKKTMPIVVKTDISCPECGSPMVMRSGRFGDYLACSNQDCKKTMPFVVKTGIACPKCAAEGHKAELVERYSKNKRRFYGCNRYPECKFVSWQKPYEKPCPQCGGLLVQDSRNGVKCTGCSYKTKAADLDNVEVGK